MLKYSQWNDILAAHYFNPEMAGKEVILFADKDLIDRLGSPWEVGLEDFIDAAKLGPSYIDRRYRDDICQLAYQTYRIGREYRFKYPPYLAYLVLFVCAATVSGDYNPNAYYPRLLDLVREDRDRNIANCFSRIDTLWGALEKWSKEIENESLGRFTKRQRGGYVHVGIPLSQTIMSEEERQKLPSLFFAAGLDPTDPPSQDVIRVKLRQYGAGVLNRRTLELLDSRRPEDQDLLGALIDFVMTELDIWDGQVVEGTDPRMMRRRINPYVRLCLSFGLGSLTSSLRFKVNPDNVAFPEGALEFRIREAPRVKDPQLRNAVFSCHQTNQAGWSTPIGISLNGSEQRLRADTLDWTSGAIFEDEEKGWRLTLRPALVRVFLPGSWERLPDSWVETQRLEYECPFLVACHQSVRLQVVSWGEKGTERFTPVQCQGLPLGWALFEGENASASSENFEPLMLPTDVRLRLAGGIKVGPGNYYLHFAKPTIVIEGAHGDVVVTVNGEEVQQQAGARLRWTLPEGLEVGVPITIEVRCDGEKLQNNRTIRLVDPEMIADFSIVPKRDMCGDIIECAGEVLPDIYAQGAIVYGVRQTEFGTVPIGVPTYLSHSIVFIGPKPGQIARWPEEQLPSDWVPVWALAKSGRARWDVHFCGRRGCLQVPLSPPTLEKKKKKAWKEAIWVNRIRNRPPEVRDLKQLWSQYVEVARNV